MLLTPAQIKPKSFKSRRNFFFLPGVDASHVFVGAWALCCFHNLTSTQTFGGRWTAARRWRVPLEWRNQIWRSLEEGAGKRCSECGPSGTDLYIYIGLPAARYARETLLLFFLLFFAHCGFCCCLGVGPHAVCQFGMADWLNRLRAFSYLHVFLIKKKKRKKSSVASAASSVALHGLPKADHCGQNIEPGTAKPDALFHHSHRIMDSSRQSSPDILPKSRAAFQRFASTDAKHYVFCVSDTKNA